MTRAITSTSTTGWRGTMRKLRVLVACEESGAIREEFRKLGHDAWSCDIQDASDGSPYHIKGDAIDAGTQPVWDLIIAHPPCTHLANSGARWFAQKRADGRQQAAAEFFMQCYNFPARFVAVENPVGVMSSMFRRPDQIVQPWMFGDEATKTTCWWTKGGLPPLEPTEVVGKGERTITKSGRSLPTWYNLPPSNPDRAKLRSKTFQGMAKAIAEQWGSYALAEIIREEEEVA